MDGVRFEMALSRHLMSHHPKRTANRVEGTIKKDDSRCISNGSDGVDKGATAQPNNNEEIKPQK